MVNTVLHGMVTPAVRPGSSMSLNTHGTNKRQKLIDGAHCVVEPSTGHKGPDTQRQQFSSPSSSDSTSAYALSVEEFAGVCSTGLGPQSFEHALIGVAIARCGRPSWLVSIYEPTILQFWVDGAQSSQPRASK